MHSSESYDVVPLSEQAVIVQFESLIDEEMLRTVLSFQKALEANPFYGFIESVPAYCSLTVYYNPVQVRFSQLPGNSGFEIVNNFLNSLKIDSTEVSLDSKSHTIPVCYDIRCGLDLIELSKSLKITPGELVSLHSQEEYLVYLIGFTPGFPYMGQLPGNLECKRRENPRKKVPAGSVAIAGKQTGIYPFETPGGWQIIGRTPVTLFNVDKEHPGLFQPGDKVNFEPISFKEFENLNKS